jgi:hypothetical protein
MDKRIGDPTILRDRVTAKTDGKRFAVFLIGMRVNRWWALRRWISVAMAMPPMLRELYQHPELGFLSAEYLMNWRGVTTLQYWRSPQDLEAFANARDHSHFPAWQQFYRKVGKRWQCGDLARDLLRGTRCRRKHLREYASLGANAGLWPRDCDPGKDQCPGTSEGGQRRL